MKRNISQNPHQATKKNPPLKTNVKDPAGTVVNQEWKYYVALGFIVAISFIAYFPALDNGFLAWDDNNYIKNNPLVHTINLKDIFTQNVMSNYHPLTILTLALEYQIFGLNETGYHAFNLFLHLLNVILVFYVLFLLSNKAGVALVASLLFGIHPLHVESVAWAAELKDLLYTFFFLISYIFYIKYLKEFKKKFYFIALLMFLLSLLSKAMAASLPVLLILTDYFKGRKLSLKTLLEKTPFFLLAIILGVVAVSAQSTSGAADMVSLPLQQRFVFACYGFITYLVKFLLPMNLSAYYPYPIKDGDDIPIQYFVYVLLFLGLITYLYYSFRSERKKIVFGIGFFAITVFLVLQLLPVGGAVMADRYSYIPSIGIFYLAGEGFIYLWDRKQKYTAIIILSVIAGFFSVKTYARCGVWENDMTLWNDVIEKYQTIPAAYYNRGYVFMTEKNNNQAMDDFNKAIELNPNFAKAYNNRGIIFLNEKRYNLALNDFSKVIALNPDFVEAYFNRGLIFLNEKKYGQALDDYSKVISLKPDYAEAYNNRGIVLKNQNNYKEALDDYNKAIALNPNYTEAYSNRGIVFFSEKKYDLALEDYNKAISLNPGYTQAYINRGSLFMNDKKYDQALEDYSKAIALNPDLPEAHINRGAIHFLEKRYQEAIFDYSRVIELNAGVAAAFYYRGFSEYYLGNRDDACKDLKQAANLGFKPAAEALPQVCR